MNVGDIEYIVSVETQQSIDAARNFDRSMDQVQQSAKKTDSEVNKLGTGFNKLALAIKTVIAATALRQMAGMVQEYQTMAERVKMATDSAEEYRLVQQRLQDTADGTYRSLSEAQELYIRTADSLKAMGYATEELVDIQDSMSYAFVTNATSADRAQAAISQFTKAVNTGKVSADQWETITSALPSVINDIADASGKSASEVRALGAAGKLAARDLTEGLRASLEQNRSSAEGMATDLIDASVRIKNAITVTLVAMEDQTGALQAVTDGIIKASEALLAFGNDSDAIADLLDAAAIAGASLAAVIAGRIVTALGASAVAMYQNTVGARALAAAELQAAQAGAKLAAEQLAQAQAAVRAAGGKNMSSGAAARLTVAENAATAATARLTAAQTAMRGAFTVSAAAANGLRTAMAFLGGPAGVVMLAAVAIYSFASRARGATKPTDELTSSIADLGNEMRKVRRIDINNKIEELDKLAAQMQRNIEFSEQYDTARLSEKATQKMQEGLQRERAALEENRKEVGRLRAAIGELNAAQDRYDFVGPPEPTTPKTGGGTTNTGPTDQLTEFQKLEQSYQNQIALAKKTGLARAELSALQRLGAEATTEEKERIAELVGQLYELEEQTKANEKAEADRLKIAEEAERGSEQNIATLAALREQLYQTTLESDELIKRQAELSLNGYATPEQLEEVRELAAELHKLQLQAEAVAVDPRTDATDRYANQLAALEEYKQAELITEQQYLELRNAAATEYEQQRLSAQEEIFRAQSQGNAFLMDSIDALGAASANVLAGLAEGAITGRDAVKMLSKAILDEAIGALVQMGVQQVKAAVMGKAAQASIAATSVASGAAVTAAWTPAAAAVSLATAGANSAPAIAGIAAAGSAAQALSAIGVRRHGGPVAAGSMYRVNEGGRPEVFQNNLGQQYMIPNERGKVISNKDASKGGGVIVNIHNAPPGTQAEQSQGPDGEQMIDIWVSDFLSDGRTSSAVQSKFGLSPQGR